MENRQPVALSIVSPSFNQGSFISETLHSIVAQDYPGLQHVVVDGHSTDNTVDVLREFDGVYGLEWISEPDRGLYDALNKALRRVTGDWVGWINCDDLYPAGVFGRVSAAIRANPDADIICGDAEIFHVLPGGVQKTLYVDHHYTGTQLNATPENLRISHLNACFFRKSLLDGVGQFDPSYKILGDRDYLFRLTRVAPPSQHLGEVICRYRSHADSLTMSTVSSTQQSPVAGSDHVMWPELKQLCRRYLKQADAPNGVRQWCRVILARRTAREAAANLLNGGLSGLADNARDGFVHHPAWTYWFLGALLRGLTRRV